MGNVEEEKSQIFVVDLTKPSVFHIIDGDNFNDYVLSPRNFITLNAIDNSEIKNIYYEIDSLGFKKYSAYFEILFRGYYRKYW